MGNNWGSGEMEGFSFWWGKARLLTYGLRVYVYVVDDLLIDAASWRLRRPFWRHFGGRLPQRLILTHAHEDHCGNAAMLASKGVMIFAPGAVLSETGVEPNLPLYRRLIWGRRPPFQAQPLPAEIETGRHLLRVIEAPGHTADHVVFLEEREGWMFTGDFFLTARPRLVLKGEDLSATIRSLERLAALPFKLILGAHEGPLQNGPALFRQKRDYLLELQEKVEVLRNHGLSDEQIDRRLFPSKPLITRVSRGEWASLNMIRTLGRPKESGGLAE